MLNASRTIPPGNGFVLVPEVVVVRLGGGGGGSNDWCIIEHQPCAQGQAAFYVGYAKDLWRGFPNRSAH